MLIEIMIASLPLLGGLLYAAFLFLLWSILKVGSSRDYEE